MKVCFSNKPVELNTNSIFLAGPTGRDGYAKSWRVEAVRYLTKTGFTGTVYIPEYTTDEVFDNKEMRRQTQWEWDCLGVAGAIVFWVPRDLEKLPGFTTNIEFGIYTESRTEHVVFGYPKGADGMSYMQLRWEQKYGKEPFQTLEETLDAAILLASRTL